MNLIWLGKIFTKNIEIIYQLCDFVHSNIKVTEIIKKISSLLFYYYNGTH